MNKSTAIFYGMEPSINNHSFLDYPENVDCLTIFFTGCAHNCAECQNLNLQKLGEVYKAVPYNIFVEGLKEAAARLRTNKITLQGGDPLHPQNRDFTKLLLSNLCNEFDFCVYTGYDYDTIKSYVVDAVYVKCGKFNKEKFTKPVKTDNYFQLASTNQKIYKNKKLISKDGRINFD